MIYKEVRFRSEARQGVLKGATTLADAVRVTLGPKSKCVLIQKSYGLPVVCNDGVTIAKEMKLQDAVEDLGAQMIRQAAERTGDAVGDGTSTATILAHAIFAEGVRNAGSISDAFRSVRTMNVILPLPVCVSGTKTSGRASLSRVTGRTSPTTPITS